MDFVDFSVSVPQGSIYRPLLFSFYTEDLGKIIRKYKLGFNQYAGDTQIYGSCYDDGREKLQMKVLSVNQIAAWIGASCLKFNSEKTEMIWFSSLGSCKIFRAILSVY